MTQSSGQPAQPPYEFPVQLIPRGGAAHEFLRRMALALCNGRLGLAVSSCGVGGIHGESAVLKSPTCTVDLFFQPVNLAPVDIVVWQPGLHDQGQEPFHSICQCLQAMDGGPEKWFSVPPATTRKKDKLMLLKATVLDERGSTWQMQVTVRTRKAAAGPN